MFEFLFKYSATVFRKGEFVFLSGWPVWLLPVLFLLGGGALFWHLQRSPKTSEVPVARRALVAVLQTLLLALLLFLLWHPAIRIATLRPQQNVVAVLVDGSRSMDLKESPDSRLDKVRSTLNSGLLQQIQDRFQVRLYAFSAQPERVDNMAQLAAGGNATRLGESLAGVLRETSSLPLGAVVVFTDGADNTGGLDRAVLAEIRQKRIPIHTVGVGRTEFPRDLEIADVTLPPRVLPGSRLSARVQLRHNGLANQRARISIRDGSRILAARDITLGNQTLQTEEVLFYSGDPGTRKLSIAVDPLPGEEVTGNNALTRIVQVVPGRRRILYVEGEPRWEFKFIRRAAEDDQSVQLVTLLRTSANKFYRQGVDDAKQLADGFPTTAAELFQYHGLIIGTIEANFFTPAQQDLIKEFVNRRGGSVLFLGGRKSFSDGGWHASAVAEVLPVRLSAQSGTFHRRPVKVELTPQGRESLLCRLEEDAEKNAQRWTKLPDLADYQITGDLKPGAVALLQAQLPGSKDIPLLVLQNYGRGRSLIFATGGSWRWRMRLDHKDLAHPTFWQQALRSLVANSPGPVQLTFDRLIYSDEDRVRVRAEVRTKTYEPAGNVTLAATLTDEGGRPTTFPMHPSADQEGVFEAEIAAAKPGTYQVEVTAHRNDEQLGRDALVFHREDGVAENFHPQQNRELLERIAAETGGRYWRLEDVAKLPAEISFSEAGITTRETLDLWDMPIVFLLLLSILSTEWLLRRKWGAV
jgi:uncharacterized membrane protein